MEWNVFGDLALATGLGFLVGVQREQTAGKIAGVRTFSLIALFGAIVATISKQFDSLWLIAAGFLAVVAFFFLGMRREKASEDETEPGVTTEFAGAVVFGIGVMVVLGFRPHAIAVSGVVAVLLHWKSPLHRFIDRLDPDDVNAVVRLVIVGMVILPVLPNETYGPYDVLNPFEIWLIVVLIVGLSIAAFVVQRLMGSSVGTVVAGLLGGLISSTATSITYARRTSQDAARAPTAAMIIMIATSVVFARVLVEVAVVEPALLLDIALPLGVVAAVTVVICVGQFYLTRGGFEESETQEVDANLKSAVVFGVMYAVVLFAVAAAEENFGDLGLYVVAGLSGLTELDAITLSTAQLMSDGRVTTEKGWRLILVGYMANLGFKAGAVGFLGDAKLFRSVAIVFGLTIAAGITMVFFWPG